ncbi:MAG: R3H domain-containing nucleic acid-binding protein [Patescibacteria group bacterium]
MDKKIKNKIEKILQEFVKKTTFDISFELKEIPEQDWLAEIKTDTPEALIGEHGQTLFDMQMLLSRIIRKQVGEDVKLDLDINQYKSNKNKYLKDLAGEIANRVALLKQEELLPAMNSYERRIIHLELALREDVATESIGEGEERRVVVRPAK